MNILAFPASLSEGRRILVPKSEVRFLGGKPYRGVAELVGPDWGILALLGGSTLDSVRGWNRFLFNQFDGTILGD